MSTHYVCGCTSEDCRLNGCLMNRQTTHPAITHCDNCGCDWLDNGLNPIGCPYCKRRGPLSDERIRIIWKETRTRMGCGGDPVLWFARAIERAHGISAPQPDEPDSAKCAECGAELIQVRPGKWQHPDCSQSPLAAEPVNVPEGYVLIAEDYLEVMIGPERMDHLRRSCRFPVPKRTPNTQPAEPVKVNAIFETENGEAIGTTNAKVKRVEWQDDGSLTVVIDYWPQ